ncbi:MAG: stage II sporulation protein D [Bacilli bacterium]|jgi:stage II sporulation protein D
MKKLIITTLIIILIPFIIVTIFIKDETIKFNFISNSVVRVKRENGNIDRVFFEEYVKGVLAGEMPTSFDLEALKAQAVAARSYVLKKMEQNKEQDYDVVDTVMNQVYLDDATLKEKWKDKYEEKNNKIKQAIVETKGEYMTYNNEVIEAFFFSTSTGKTENSGEVFQTQLPYLKSVDSAWDEEVSPVFSQDNNLSLEEFYQKLNIEYNPNLKIEITKTTSTGRIKELKINDHEFKANDIYQKLNLRSTFFDIKQKDNQVEITTKGYGHGVGMSQYGALAMAKKGYKYQDILKYYYQGVEIKKL